MDACDAVKIVEKYRKEVAEQVLRDIKHDLPKAWNRVFNEVRYQASKGNTKVVIHRNEFGNDVTFMGVIESQPRYRIAMEYLRDTLIREHGYNAYVDNTDLSLTIEWLS